MKNVDLDNPDLKRIQMFFYLIPIIGFFPSLWTLYRHGNKRSQGRGDSFFPPTGVAESSDPMKPQEGGREQLAVSRLSVTLAGSWLLSYLLLNTGAETSEFLALRLLVLNSLLTSGYFLVSLWLMVRLYSRKSLRLPGFSRLADRLLDK